MSRIAPPGGPGFKLIAYWVAAVAAMLTCTHTVPAGEETAEASISAGRRIFFGETPLRGVIVGQSEHLPASVVACANCHAAGSPLFSGKPFGPPLNRATLTEPRSRRYGPPSRFSLESFCRLLQAGVDPAYIVITRGMPRYVLSAGQCLALWRYLTETSDE
jgi:hypothetical protein